MVNALRSRSGCPVFRAPGGPIHSKAFKWLLGRLIQHHLHRLHRLRFHLPVAYELDVLGHPEPGALSGALGPAGPGMWRVQFRKTRAFPVFREGVQLLLGAPPPIGGVVVARWFSDSDFLVQIQPKAAVDFLPSRLNIVFRSKAAFGDRYPELVGRKSR